MRKESTKFLRLMSQVRRTQKIVQKFASAPLTSSDDFVGDVKAKEALERAEIQTKMAKRLEQKEHDKKSSIGEPGLSEEFGSSVLQVYSNNMLLL